MADTKLSALSAITSLGDADEIYVNDGGTSKKMTGASVRNSVIGGASAKTAPVNADSVPIVDSEASSVAKTVTLANLSKGLGAATTSVQGAVELATAAEMVTGTDTGRVPSVSVVKNAAGVAKAWCKFDGNTAGTNSPTVGYNITSVTKTDTGDYTVTIANDMGSGDYVVSAVASVDSVQVNSMAAGSFTITTKNMSGGSLSPADPDIVCVTVFGTLA